MKVLLDECVDRRLAHDIVGHDVRTASQMGWTMIKDRELLALASGRFDVFVTVDRNLSFQQNLAPCRFRSLCCTPRRTGFPISGRSSRACWRPLKLRREGLLIS